MTKTHRAAPFPLNEKLRLRELRHLHVLDSLPELAYAHVVGIASKICSTPISLISLVDDERQWFKASVGLALAQTHRDDAFCAHAILRPDEVMVVEDAAADPRFANNPLVLGEPHIRFYAGAPIVTPAGHAMGTVCVIDTVKRKIDRQQQDVLRALARQTAGMLRLRALVLREELNRNLPATRSAILEGKDSSSALPKIKSAWAQAQFWRN